MIFNAMKVAVHQHSVFLSEDKDFT